MNNDLICVGNAIIDIVSKIDDKLLNEFELQICQVKNSF